MKTRISYPEVLFVGISVRTSVTESAGVLSCVLWIEISVMTREEGSMTSSNDISRRPVFMSKLQLRAFGGSSSST